MKHSATKSLFSFSSPNLVALAVNISRVYEIAQVGNHTVKIVANELCCKQDANLLMAFYGFKDTENPDIIAELAYHPDDVLNCFYNNTRFETLQDINKRLPVIKPLPETIDVSSDLDNSSLALLKAAINKLHLGVNDVLIIHKVAQTIAIIEQSKVIKPEHIAEAIQYRAM